MYASVAWLNEAKQGSIGLSVLGLGLWFEGLLLKAQCTPGHTLSMLWYTPCVMTLTQYDLPAEPGALL